MWPGQVGVGRDLPAREVDGLQAGLDHLHGLVAGQRAERVDVRRARAAGPTGAWRRPRPACGFTWTEPRRRSTSAAVVVAADAVASGRGMSWARSSKEKARAAPFLACPLDSMASYSGRDWMPLVGGQGQEVGEGLRRASSIWPNSSRGVARSGMPRRQVAPGPADSRRAPISSSDHLARGSARVDRAAVLELCTVGAPTATAACAADLRRGGVLHQVRRSARSRCRRARRPGSGCPTAMFVAHAGLGDRAGGDAAAGRRGLDVARPRAPRCRAGWGSVSTRVELRARDRDQPGVRDPGAVVAGARPRGACRRATLASAASLRASGSSLDRGSARPCRPWRARRGGGRS